MKQIILLFLSVFTISTYSQTYRNPNGNTVKVEVRQAPKTSADHIRDMQRNISNSFSKAAANSGNNSGTNADEATKDKYTKIIVDDLINNDGYFRGIYVKKVSGWQPANNKATIKNIIKGSDKLNLFSKEKNLPKNTETLEKVLFLDWERQALTQYSRLTKITLSDYKGNIVYQAVHKNIPHIEMLLPLTSEYVITKEQAISKMKEFKEILDLEILTRKEYDSILKVMKPFILNN